MSTSFDAVCSIEAEAFADASALIATNVLLDDKLKFQEVLDAVKRRGPEYFELVCQCVLETAIEIDNDSELPDEQEAIQEVYDRLTRSLDREESHASMQRVLSKRAAAPFVAANERDSLVL
ncbi:MAG: hypothetical protein JST12_14940 [Armatimonadetes bacterium]|nr:hypothetical protein [Armatimonadota bacterium]